MKTSNKHVSGIGTLILILTWMLVLQACSGTPDSTPTTGPLESPTEATAQWPRTITDARGVEVTLKEKPHKMAATSWQITENLMALHTPPIAADTVAVMAEWASMKDYFAQYPVESIGDSHMAINLEKLAALQPDLILASTSNAEIYDQLEQIAPLFVFDSLFFDWEGSLRKIASVIGEEEKAETYIAQLLEQVAAVREKASTSQQTVAFASAAQGALYTFNVDQLAMYYDDEKGIALKVPEAWPKERAAMSIEGFSEINPDILFLSVNDHALMEELKQSNVWKSLAAVKSDQVFQMDVSGLTGGPLAVQYGINTVNEALNEK